MSLLGGFWGGRLLGLISTSSLFVFELSKTEYRPCRGFNTLFLLLLLLLLFDYHSLFMMVMMMMVMMMMMMMMMMIMIFYDNDHYCYDYYSYYHDYYDYWYYYSYYYYDYIGIIVKSIRSDPGLVKLAAGGPLLLGLPGPLLAPGGAGSSHPKLGFLSGPAYTYMHILIDKYTYIHTSIHIYICT